MSNRLVQGFQCVRWCALLVSLIVGGACESPVEGAWGRAVEGETDFSRFVQPEPPAAPPPAPPGHITLVNFASDGSRLIRFDTHGNSIDVHDGEIERFGDLYYLYGVAYRCGFEWMVPRSPYCGVHVYSSPDLTEWTNLGPIFDFTAPIWDARCGGSTFGCFRPHVAYNPNTRRYVLWINAYDVGSGYRVFDSASPGGPFRERRPPRLAVASSRVDVPNSQYSGDHNLFVDDDGTGYVVYTDWRAGGDIVVEELTPNFLSGTGRHVRLGLRRTEAPSMFKREGRYYITISDPACPYCRTGTSYLSATDPLGPWSGRTLLNANSCGGQPTHVSELPAAGGGKVYLYQSDLWNDYEKNQTTAGQFWTPLEFTSTGEIRPFRCDPYVYAPLAVSRAPEGSALTANRFQLQCDIGTRSPEGTIHREASFIPARTGRLRAVALPLYRKGSPSAPLLLEIRSASEVLQRASLGPQEVPLDARRRTLQADVPVVAGRKYSVRLSADLAHGCYGFASYRDDARGRDTNFSVSSDGGRSWRSEPNRTFKLDVQIESE